MQIYTVNDFYVKRMSRGNVFKVSGNMALGGSDYGSTDIEQIKNSLKLLKAKKNQRSSVQQSVNNYNFGQSSIPSKNYPPQKAEYNYQALSKNHLPTSQKDTGGFDYGKKNYNNEYSDPKSYNKKQPDPYDYSNKPPSYPQQNNTRTRNIQSMQQPQTYDDYPSYSKKNIGKSSTAQTKTSELNSYSRQQPQKQQPKQSSRQQYQQEFENYRQERSIKEVNRQNRVDIVQYDPSQLRPCKVCGRKFNPDSINKHESHCKQVFQKKRKQFNAQEQRIIDNQQKKLMKRGEIIQQKIEAQQKAQKIPKWKAQSLALRAGLKHNRMEAPDPQQAALLQQVQNEAGVKCPHCGRKFNETAGPKHVKFCQQQAKKNSMKKKK